MKRILFLSILMVFFTVLLVGCNNQKSEMGQAPVSDQQLKEDYDLQEKCSKRSEEWFKNKYGNSDDFADTSYINHYNKKMNKCFILVTIEKDAISSKDYSKTEYLFDVNENKKYGSVSYAQGLAQQNCSFLGKMCNFWYREIQPYMEESI